MTTAGLLGETSSVERAYTMQIPSDSCPFNEAPDMKAFEITEAGKEALLSKRFQMVRVNYANPDMVRAFRCRDPQPPYACSTLRSCDHHGSFSGLAILVTHAASN